ncbi:MAG: DNA repair exonuclease [Clostridia bacterium]|nr:DNA repair exonuclease [Clostridia bacterium]
MKIIHTGDVHLGSAFGGLSKDRASIRQAELLDGFRRLCAYAKESGVTAALIAGDLFDGEKTSQALCREALTAIEQAQPVCFFYVSGNHDEGIALQEKPSNLYLFSQNRSWASYDLPENITVTGIDGKYLTSEKYGQLCLRAERFNIVMMHGDIHCADGADGISLPHLQNRNVDYLALGHIHIPNLQAERLDGRGKYRYCGCLEGRGFDEVGKRGFFLLDIQNGKIVKEEFLTFSRREIVERAVDISVCRTYYDVENCVLNALIGARREDTVKVILRGRHLAGLKKDISLLTARLSQNFFHVKVVDEAKIIIDHTAFENDLSERGEFVREVGRYAMSEEERAEILDVGLKALAGEEIDL